MRISIEDLIPRVINVERLQHRYREGKQGEGLDYYESGMDLRIGEDFYDSFVEYQKVILREFDKMTREFHFHVIDSSRSFEEINNELREGILPFLEEDETAKKTSSD
jgi:dTMP kinase